MGKSYVGCTNRISGRINITFETKNVTFFYLMYGGHGECSFEIIWQNVISRIVGQTVRSTILEYLGSNHDIRHMRLKVQEGRGCFRLVPCRHILRKAATHMTTCIYIRNTSDVSLHYTIPRR